ncbi:RNA polymerase sigma factor [Streptomyces sp. NPDC057592]|uniref:RNA polymerase sigma factor n=1 Tax=unclassified Streptomyces TaxID=2593676 RepID=UPI0036CA4C94
MYDGTAAGESITTETDQDLTSIFRTHSDRLTRWVYNRLDRADWHLAEDLVQETFVWLFELGGVGDLSDDEAGAALKLIARHVIDDHYRTARPEPMDIGDLAEGDQALVEASAEDTGLANITILTMLAEARTSLGVAA